ncbi:MAG: phosphatidate cytidylyltransferase [Oscillospiraceae bacterium]|nr:phosphatidate cytidylyltransferase [Oscillospiraceae bacterium]
MNIKKRLLPAAVIVIVTFGCILLSRPSRVLFFVALAAVSALELENVLRQAELPVSKVLLILYSAVQGILCFFRVQAQWEIAWYALAAFAAMFWGVLQPERGARFAVGNVFALLWPFGFYALTIRAAASDLWLPALTIGILGTWACDSMALIGGKLWGRHKLAPRVSPNKTWEGTVTGGLSAILAGVLISLVLRKAAPVPVVPCTIIAFAASCFGQVGDLAASLIKRMAGVKDYGHLMPEHGGIMDKMDSMLFSIPAAYLGLYIYSLVG